MTTPTSPSTRASLNARCEAYRVLREQAEPRRILGKAVMDDAGNWTWSDTAIPDIERTPAELRKALAEAERSA